MNSDEIARNLLNAILTLNDGASYDSVLEEIKYVVEDIIELARSNEEYEKEDD
jgi:uncharacterized protein YjfI (DUF2170 family)